MLIPCSLGNNCCTFDFLIFIIVERNSLYNSLYILTERSLKHLCSIRAWVPMSFFLSLSLPLTNSLECRNPRSSFSCPGFQDPLKGALCLRDRYKPCSRVLLILCINQGVSASFSLSLSYHQLQTTRFQSIKDHNKWNPNRDLVCVAFQTEGLLRSVSTYCKSVSTKWLESPIISLLYFNICLKLRDFRFCANE